MKLLVSEEVVVQVDIVGSLNRGSAMSADTIRCQNQRFVQFFFTLQITFIGVCRSTPTTPERHGTLAVEE